MKQDIRLALRAIARAPSYALMVIGSLAIGIAAPALAFSILNAALLRPFDGVEDGDGLLAVGLRDERGRPFSTYEDYTALRDGLRDVASLAAQTSSSFALSHDGGDAVILNGELVSANYFDTLKLRPAAGRLFSGGVDVLPMRDPVAVIGFTTWRRRFQSDPGVVGRSVIVNGMPLQIIGVAPERFHGVTGPENETELWLPLGLAELALRREERPVTVQQADPRNFTYVARLRPDVTIDQVRAQASALVARASNGSGARTVLISASSRSPVGHGFAAAALIVSIMALPLLVLAIACVNAGNLVLARATRSSAVWGIQLALGASRTRLLRQPLIEGVLLALPAAAAGLILTGWAFPALRDLMPLDLVIDWRVTVFAVTIATATPLAFGLAPAWSVLSRADQRKPGHVLQVSPKSRVRTALIVAQAALSLALLGTGVQFVRTVAGGFGDGFGRGDTLLMASVDVDKARFTRDAADAFYATVLDRVRTVPGAGAAAMAGGLSFVAGVPRDGQAAVWLPGDSPAEPRRSLIAYVAGDPFRILGVSLVSGRIFLPEEHLHTPRTVVVNEPFARQVLGGNALGRTLRVAPTNVHAEGTDVVVVGVVGGAQGPRNDALPTVFSPAALGYLPARTLYIPFRDAASLAAAVPAVREAIRQVDPRVPYTIGTLDDVRAQRAAPSRFTAISVVTLGAWHCSWRPPACTRLSHTSWSYGPGRLAFASRSAPRRRQCSARLSQKP